MNRILFSQTFFATDVSGNSKPQFEAGKHYPTDDAEAKRCIARGIATEVDVPDAEVEGATDGTEPEHAADEATNTAPTTKKAKKA